MPKPRNKAPGFIDPGGAGICSGVKPFFLFAREAAIKEMTTDEMKILLDLQKQVSSIDGRTTQILEQTKKTNGHVADLQQRVTTIETKMATEKAASTGEGKVKRNIGSKVWAVTERAIGVVLGIAIGKVMK